MPLMWCPAFDNFSVILESSPQNFLIDQIRRPQRPNAFFNDSFKFVLRILLHRPVSEFWTLTLFEAKRV